VDRDPDAAPLRFAKIADRLRDIVWVAEIGSARVLYVNPAFEDIYGETREALYDNPRLWLERVHPEDRERIRQLIQQPPLDGEEMLYRIVRPDGAVRWLQCHRSELRESAQVYGFGVVRDITRLHESEQLIGLQQARLNAATKMATLGEMAASIAHEINNPLTIIDGRLHLLMKRVQRGDISREETLALLEATAATTGRIAAIVRAMRNFSREVSADPLVTVRVSEILDQTLAFCRERYTVHGIELSVDQGLDPTVVCRPVQVTQVLLNLLNNAFDAAAAAQPTAARWVQVQVQARVAEAGEVVEIAVSDSGRGVASEHRARLFSPFFTTKPPGQGTGLGLSVARRIAQAHGGDLSLDEASPATRFVLRLPRPSVSSGRPGACAPTRSTP